MDFHFASSSVVTADVSKMKCLSELQVLCCVRIYNSLRKPNDWFMHGLLCQVEAIMNDFVQLRADTDRNENETMVEG